MSASRVRIIGKNIRPNDLAQMMVESENLRAEQLRKRLCDDVRTFIQTIKEDLLKEPESSEEQEERVQRKLPSLADMVDDLEAVWVEDSLVIRFGKYSGLASRILENGTYGGIPSRPYQAKLSRGVKQIIDNCRRYLTAKQKEVFR